MKNLERPGPDTDPRGLNIVRKNSLIPAGSSTPVMW